MSSAPSGPAAGGSVGVGPERARLFVAIWPPLAVVRALTSLRGADQPGVRWMGPEHWHVTLRFLGTVEVEPALRALDRLAGEAGAAATVGAAPIRLGREVVAFPVDGLERLAAAVDLAFHGLGRDPDHRPFRGHLTLARGKGVRDLHVPALAGPMYLAVRSVSLVRSHLGSGGARYEDVAVAPLGPVLG